MANVNKIASNIAPAKSNNPKKPEGSKPAPFEYPNNAQLAAIIEVKPPKANFKKEDSKES